jgi:ElaB/YqjD/DUF883 family membrane-anchored ribosome-binding protein
VHWQTAHQENFTMENQTGTTGTYGTTGTTGASNGIGSTGSSANVVDRVAQSAHEVVDRVAAKAGPAMEKMRSSASGYKEQLHAKADQFGAMEEQWMESARGYVREHPFTAITVAVVAGMLIAKMTSSSNR